MTNKTRLAPALALLPIAAVAVLFSTGCESSDDNAGSYWTTETHTSSSQAAKPASSSSSSTSSSSSSSGTTSSAQSSGDAEQTGAIDEVPFGALSWDFGGVNGGHAAKTEASIGHLHASGSSMSYRWTGPTLRSWGMSDGDAGALACFFVQRSDGRWVGGKFDWISTSRTSRGLEHVIGGYGGWSLAGVPNPCPCAFVIISADGKKRTNVIAGVWSR